MISLTLTREELQLLADMADPKTGKELDILDRVYYFLKMEDEAPDFEIRPVQKVE